MINGPTLNDEYNQLLIKWSNGPECESCGKDLTGKMIYDLGYCWACENCKNETMFFEDPNYERKQMGLVDY